MYGSTSAVSISSTSSQVPASVSNRFKIKRVTATPTGSDVLGTVAILTSEEITRFIAYSGHWSGLNANNGLLFSFAGVGTVFWLMKFGGSNTISIPGVPFRLSFASGTGVYQKSSASETLIKRSAWIYTGSAWQSINF